MSLPKGFRGWCMGASITMMMGLVVLAASFSPTRKYLLQPFLPKPGEGPSKEKRESGYFNILIKTKGAYVRVKGFQDPGYGATSLMLSQAAMALILDRETLPERYGVLTPASALGMTLIKRLRDAGMVFSFHTD